ncbi:hypothetical protein AVEN_138976-1 [Araneus ventricosus]|uniref:Uncharacterized protein n=1 Tax=Araneus ventricosus TaxID=182803 RepID=A0A4Y2N685_ARAVE|nr:hypothetical protein AVEN_138976-1 [Araneus ventricosus]
MKHHEDYFVTYLVILNRSQMTRTTPGLATPLLTSAPQQREGVWHPTYDLKCNRPNTRRILVESGFKPGALKSQSQDFTTRPPRPP